MVRIAALQMNFGTVPEPNLDALEVLAHEATARGAVYALSPEVSMVFAENRDGLQSIVDPWGKILGELGGDGAGVLFADIDPKAVAEARANVPALANTRSFSLSVNDASAIS